MPLCEENSHPAVVDPLTTIESFQSTSKQAFADVFIRNRQESSGWKLQPRTGGHSICSKGGWVAEDAQYFPTSRFCSLYYCLQIFVAEECSAVEFLCLW